MHYRIDIYRECAGERSVRIGIDRSEREKTTLATAAGEAAAFFAPSEAAGTRMLVDHQR